MSKHVVVTIDASAGAGRATAQVFAASGARIRSIARSVDRLDATAREMHRQGASVLPALASRSIPCHCSANAGIRGLTDIPPLRPRAAR